MSTGSVVTSPPETHIPVVHATHAEVRIRAVCEQDYGAIAAIYNEAIDQGGITMEGQHQTTTDVAAMVAKMNHREALLVAELPGISSPKADISILGWGIVKRYSDRLGYQVCCETSIYLTFSQTGKGYGNLLQKALMAKVAAYGYHHVVAKILANNTASIKFHQRFGFEPVGIQKEIGFLNGTWHDVMIMQCLLPQSAPNFSEDSPPQTEPTAIELPHSYRDRPGSSIP